MAMRTFEVRTLVTSAKAVWQSVREGMTCDFMADLHRRLNRKEANAMAKALAWLYTWLLSFYSHPSREWSDSQSVAGTLNECTSARALARACTYAYSVRLAIRKLRPYTPPFQCPFSFSFTLPLWTFDILHTATALAMDALHSRAVR
jgi:hypothetical protein